MDKPLVSAVITTCKRPMEIVARALQSILAQTYPRLEIFVIDDSPADYDGRDAVAAYMASQPAVRYLPNEKNSGACYSRNRGLSLAKGKYIAFLDDDDEWMPEKIEKAVAVLERGDIGMVYCFGRQYDDDNAAFLADTGSAFQGDFYARLLHTTNFIGGVSYPVMDTERFREIGGFDTEMQSAQDFDAWLRMAQSSRIVCIEEPLVIYHWHSGEQISKNPKKKISGISRILEKNAAYFEAHPEDRWIYENALVGYYAMDGQKKRAFSMWWKTVCKRPFALRENLRTCKRILSK